MELLSFFHSDLLTITIRLLVAVILAGFIGLEREVKHQPAGFRTHILVGVGACLMMILSIYGFEPFINSNYNTIRFDPARIPSYVISGIGFLGAGTILVHGRTVKGLTTAASIWVVAGIGLVVGAGMYYEAILATLIVVISLFLLTKIEPIYILKQSKKHLVVLAEEELSLNELVAIMNEAGIEIEKKSIDRLKKSEQTVMKHTFLCKYKHDSKMDDVLEKMSKMPKVKKVSYGME